MSGLEILAWIIGIVVLVGYSINLKDVYFGYGKAVAMIYQAKNTVTYDEYGGLIFTSPKGSKEVYFGSLGYSVAKLLMKNRAIDEANFKPTTEGAEPPIFSNRKKLKFFSEKVRGKVLYLAKIS